MEANKDKLEQLLDAWSLSDMFLALTEICYEKAEHIRANWVQTYKNTVKDALGKGSIPDEPYAAAWKKAAQAAHTASLRSYVKRVS